MFLTVKDRRWLEGYHLEDDEKDVSEVLICLLPLRRHLTVGPTVLVSSAALYSILLVFSRLLLHHLARSSLLSQDRPVTLFIISHCQPFFFIPCILHQKGIDLQLFDCGQIYFITFEDLG